MSRVSQVERLKTKADKLQQESDRAQGRLEEAQRQMKEAFEVETLEDAEKLLEELKTDEEEADEVFQTALEAFDHKWGEELGNV